MDESSGELKEQKELFANKECEELLKKLNNHEDNLNKPKKIKAQTAEK